MHKPTITVAIPSYNKEKFISRCIDSVLKQTMAADQIILIDNASSDRTYEIAKGYQEKISRLQNASNIGQVPNWNRCIEVCETDWLLILHADDELLPNTLANYHEIIKKNPSIGLIHSDCMIEQEGLPETRSYSSRNTHGFYTAGENALSCEYGACSTVLVKKEAYNKLGKFVESCSADVEMWARIAATYDIFSHPAAAAVYYSSPLSYGPQSLINRSVKEIVADWDNLNKKIAAVQPTEKARLDYVEKCERDAPGNYLSILKAGIRARNIKNTADVLFLLMRTKGGPLTLSRFMISYFNKLLRK
jgi:glycosyltransferase involved in cell wall biosynthesis